MSINQKLKHLYSAYWDDFKHAVELCPCAPSSLTPANPLLLQVDEGAFASASKRIVICGQEAAWGVFNFERSIDERMSDYSEFFIKGKFYPGVGRSAFFKAFRYFKREFRQLFGKDDCIFIYQNVSKMARSDGKNGVTPEIRRLERDHFPVLREEMAILQPDIVLFLSGPNRDGDIKFHFPDVQFSAVGTESNPRKLAWLASPDLPVASLRLYHPRFYRAWTNEYKSLVVGLINQRCEQDGLANRSQPICSETNSTPPVAGSRR